MGALIIYGTLGGRVDEEQTRMLCECISRWVGECSSTVLYCTRVGPVYCIIQDMEGGSQ